MLLYVFYDRVERFDIHPQLDQDAGACVVHSRDYGLTSLYYAWLEHVQPVVLGHVEPCNHSELMAPRRLWLPVETPGLL